MSLLMDALQGAGSLLSAPGDYTRGVLAGKPGERVGGRDLLRGYGLASDEDNWGNFLGGLATDVATDPLTYAGGYLGKAARGLIPFSPTESGLATAGKGLGGAGKFKEPLREVATLTGLEVGAPVSGAGRVGVPLATGETLSGQMSGRTAAQMGRGDMQGRLLRMAGEGAGDSLGAVEGGYNPGSKTVFAGADQSGRLGDTLRHERIHAIIDQAAQGAGNMSDLPMLMRLPAQLKSSNSALARSLGTVGDELAAQTLENRTLGGQLQGAAGYLFNPQKNASYASAFARGGIDPRVVALYGALPKVPLAAGAGTGGGSGWLARALSGGEQ